MKFFKYKEKVIVCFLQEELKHIFDESKKAEMLTKIMGETNSLSELEEQQDKLVKIVDELSKKTANHRDDHEVFASLYAFAAFFEAESQICFPLKSSFNHNKDTIRTLSELNAARTDPPDFIIKSTDGYREFELKRYREANLTTDEVFEYLKARVGHYGQDLGDSNLLVILQSPSHTMNIDFKDLHDKLKPFAFKSGSEILISYNSNNEKMVIVRVSPSPLSKSSIPFNLPSDKT